MSTTKMPTAKIFQNGQSQAVRIPKKFRFENQNEVFIKKVGDSILLTPKQSASPWDIMFEAAAKFSDDFMEERNQPEAQIREDIF